jgi:regulator of cell morphogenesis and NO signaling
MSVLDLQRTVGELVTERPSRSRVFETLGIDYCCGGRKPLGDACAEQGLDPGTVARLLEAPDATAPAAPEVEPAAMTLTQLADHIEATHHAFLSSELPRLTEMVRKVASVHGTHYPWLIELSTVFNGFVHELNDHMQKEERVLFPMIRALEQGDVAATAHCGGLSNPIRAMEHEHDSAGAAMETMRGLSDGYRPPEGACNTFRAMLDALGELERDMHQHVHKENNVLFPRAEALAAGQ